MAFEIGDRIDSWMGTGTVIGPLERDADNTAVQRVAFDNPMFGERLREVGKMTPLDGEPKAKGRDKLQKEGGDGTKA